MPERPFLKKLRNYLTLLKKSFAKDKDEELSLQDRQKFGHLCSLLPALYLG